MLYVQDAGYAVSTSPSCQKQFAYRYNDFGQKVQEANLNGTITQYSYGDPWGNLTQVVQDPHVTSGDSHLVRTTQMVTDPAGRVLQSTDPKQQTSHFSYSPLGQPTSAFFPATANTPAETVSYTYGANGRTESVTDNRGTTTLAYEAGNDRVSSITDPVTGTMGYTYLPTGERASLTLPGGGTWNYTYDSYTLRGGNDKVLCPKDDPNSMGRKFAAITDDQGEARGLTRGVHLAAFLWSRLARSFVNQLCRSVIKV